MAMESPNLSEESFINDHFKDANPDTQPEDQDSETTAQLIASYCLEREILQEYYDLRSQICEQLLADGSDETKIGKIRNLLLRLHLNRKKPFTEPTGIELQALLILSKNTLVMLGKIEDIRIKTIDVYRSFKDIADIVRSAEETSTKLAKISNIMMETI